MQPRLGRPHYIPDDVWMHIAQFIPQDYLKDLFPVNRSFFYASMNSRYRTVDLCILDFEKFKLLVRLQDQLIAKRVRYLSVEPLFFVKALREPMLAGVGRATLVERNAQFMTIDFDWSNPKRELDRYMGRAITNMSNVIGCAWASVELPSDFFPNWPPFCQNLEQLILCHPITRVVDSLESAHFPCLSDLTVHLFGVDQQTTSGVHGSSVVDIVASFVSRLKPTLKQLDVRVDSRVSSSLFGQLDHFPRLIRLEMDVQVFPSGLNDQIIRFIVKHAPTLEYCSFTTNACSWWDASNEQILEAVRRASSIGLPFSFPRLQTMALDTSLRGSLLAPCIPPFVNTVTTLILKEQYLSMEDLNIISNVFACSRGVLTSAWFDLRSLDPQNVDLLAEKFRSLTDLTLKTRCITGNDSDVLHDFYSENAFYNAMEGRLYQLWLLRNVAIIFKPGCLCNPLLCWRAMAAMAKSVPSIQSFNNQGDTEIPEGFAERSLEEFMEATCFCGQF